MTGKPSVFDQSVAPELSAILDNYIRSAVSKFWAECSGKYSEKEIISATLYATGWAFINIPTGPDKTLSRNGAHEIIDILKDNFDKLKEAEHVTG
jgi:hypothetical protein